IPSPTPSNTDYQTIDVNTLEQQEPKTVGAEHLLLHISSQLQIPAKLRELGLSQNEIALCLGNILARAIFPTSERCSLDWLCHKSGLGELLGFEFKNTMLDKFYAASDILLKHKLVLEQHLAAEQRKVHGVQSTMILYDLTNTYMEGQAKANPK